MRALLQRVTDAQVMINGQTVGSIARGFVVLLGVGNGDTEADAAWLAQKVLALRVFADDQGKMNRSVTDMQGALLVIPQFTLYADTAKGTRPSFVDAAPPADGERLYDAFVRDVRSSKLHVEIGRFGADMQVTLTNDGPVTIWLDHHG